MADASSYPITTETLESIATVGATRTALTASMQLSEQMRRLTDVAAPYTKLAKMFAPLAAVQQPAVLSRQYDGLVDRLGLRHPGLPGVLEEQRQLHERFAKLTGLFQQKLPIDLQSDSFRSMRKILAGVSVGRSLLDPFQRQHAAPASLVPPAAGDLWAKHLRGLALPAASFLSLPHQRPMALLSNVPELEGASLSWLQNGREGPRLSVATITERREDQTPFEVEVEVVCSVCESEMSVSSREHSWVGRKLRVRLEVTPICNVCLGELGWNWDRWCEALTSIADKPKLRLIEGGNDGDGVRRGKVRLVRPPAEDDE
ncbi:MAG: hypothetical protein IPJ34_13325 [Myxococcales bacterium]|nr:hypothetical protein [Myxococcales bacterium]